jgi:hypothetical protein
MNSRSWVAAATAAALAATLAVACNDPATEPDNAQLSRAAEGPPGTHRQYGTPVKVGNGMARAYIVLNHGVPSELGIALSERALQGLPAPTGGFPDSHSWVLDMPAQNPTQYQVIELDWNPVGHPPPMVYTVPHFDFHFYTISLAERNAIVPGPDFGTKATNLPPVQYRPAGYVGDMMGVPMMGMHWLDPANPEFHGLPFTSTFIYGSWDGHFIFAEPMVTRAYLESKPDTMGTISVPTAFEEAGYHPTAYRVTYDARAKEFRVAITGLTEHSGS